MLPEVRKEFDRLWSKKAKELISQGYSPRLVEKAKEFADDYIQGFTSRYFSELATKPEKLKEVQMLMLDDAISMAEKWVKGITEVFVPVKKAKLGEAVSL